MKTAASIFKAYDIRRRHRADPSDEAFAGTGRAFGSEAVAAGERAVAVGRDGRLSGPGLVAALTRGLASTGLDVVDSAVTTPMLYYVAATRGAQGLPLRASRSPAAHNPKDYTASRWCWPAVRSYGDDIQRLASASRRRYAQGQGRIGPHGHPRRVHHRIASDAKLARPMEDSSSIRAMHSRCVGAGDPARARLPGRRDVLRGRRRFPNHHPILQAGEPGPS